MHCTEESWWLQCTQRCCLTLNSPRKIPPAHLGLQPLRLEEVHAGQRCFGELSCLDGAGSQREMRAEAQEAISPNPAQLESPARANINKQSVCLYPTFLLK